ncbi:MAG: amidohydrolase family protein [Clostridia bacterium]|nr:amidohydrolase family protein [Clostridia bacterium]
MIIDFHTHIFPEKIAEKTVRLLEKNSNGTAYTNGTVDGLIEAMERGCADLCVCLPVLTKPEQFESVTRFAIGVNEKYSVGSKRLISFGGMHPKCEDIYGKMRFLKKNGFKGVKIHPDYQSTFIDDDGYVQILKAAKDLDMIVVTHAGVDDGYIGLPVKCPPELAKKVIKKVGHNKFVLAHYGGHKQWEQVYDLLAGEDVYIDTAFTLHEIDEELFKKILYKHGEDKVLFATDCPWRDIKDDVKILKSYNLGEKTENKLFFENAADLLGLKV